MAGEVIIFDFDGTIADSYRILVNITNNLSSEFGYKPVEESELDIIKSLSVKEIVEKYQISRYKIPFLLNRVKNELQKEINSLRPIPEMGKVLRTLYENNYKLGIITSNSQENVIKFLEINNLKSLFEFIDSGRTIFGKHHIINKTIKSYNFDRSSVFYVGDETRDIRSAKKSGIKIIAVTWGFNSKQNLAKYQPDYSIDNPKELLTIFLEK